jgi:energy-converting hydrogenase Eha subunit C
VTVRDSLTHPGVNASAAEKLVWFRNVEVALLVAGVIAVVAAAVYLPIWMTVILGLIWLHTAYRIITLNRRIEEARGTAPRPK